jgi:hypothetical protein
MRNRMQNPIIKLSSSFKVLGLKLVPKNLLQRDEDYFWEQKGDILSVFETLYLLQEVHRTWAMARYSFLVADDEPVVKELGDSVFQKEPVEYL